MQRTNACKISVFICRDNNLPTYRVVIHGESKGGHLSLWEEVVFNHWWGGVTPAHLVG